MNLFPLRPPRNPLHDGLRHPARSILAPAAVVVGLGLALGACGTDNAAGSGSPNVEDSSNGAASAQPPVTVTVSPSSSATASSGSAGSASPDSPDSPEPSSAGSDPSSSSSEQNSGSGGGSATPTSVPLCGTPDLDLALSTPAGSGSAGAARKQLTFHNTSDHSCTLDGYSGVSFVSGSEQVGAAAARIDSAQRVKVTLIPNAHATEVITIQTPGAFPACDSRTYGAIKVYPPHNRGSIVLKSSGTTCGSDSAQVLQVSPVQPVS